MHPLQKRTYFLNPPFGGRVQYRDIRMRFEWLRFGVVR